MWYILVNNKDKDNRCRYLKLFEILISTLTITSKSPILSYFSHIKNIYTRLVDLLEDNSNKFQESTNRLYDTITNFNVPILRDIFKTHILLF